MTETKKIRKATTTEIIAINNLLREHLAKTPEGNYSYLDDWSDARIAAEVDPSGELSASAIARVRLEVFGSIKPPDSPRRQEIEDIYRHMTRVEARLRDEITDLKRRIVSMELVPRPGSIADADKAPTARHEERQGALLT